MAIIYGLLVKWLNTLPSQGSIHGSESRTDYHLKINRLIRFNMKTLINSVFLCK